MQTEDDQDTDKDKARDLEQPKNQDIENISALSHNE